MIIENRTNSFQVEVAPDRGGAWIKFIVKANSHEDAKQAGQAQYQGVGQVMVCRQLTYTQADRDRFAGR